MLRSSQSLPGSIELTEDGVLGDSREHAKTGSIGPHNILQPSGGAKNVVDGSENNATDAGGGDALQVQYLAPRAMALLEIGLMMAMFVVALDNTIISTALPQITTEFDALLDVGWYGSIYILCTVCLQPTYGKIYTFWDIKWCFLQAIAIFEVGSILCAAAPNSKVLIVGRTIAGCGAAGVYAGVMSIVGYAAPLEKRATYIALIISMFAVAAIAGPLIGGALTSRLSWRWCFWINPFIGAFSSVFTFFFFKSPKRTSNSFTFLQKLEELDILGSLLLIGACVCLLVALQQGGTTYAWSDSHIWGLIAIGFPLLLALFLYQQRRRGDRAIIPPRIFFQRTVLSSCLFAFFQMAAVFVHVFYLPFYFQAIQGVDPVNSGLRSIPYLLANVVPAIVIAIILPLVGYFTPFMIAGGACAIAGSVLLYTLRIDTPASGWIGYQVLAGFGVGISAQLPLIAIQTVIEVEDYPTGNAIYIFFQNLGGSITISVAQTILQNSLYSEIPQKAPGISAQDVITVGATNLRTHFPETVLPGILQAYMVAINNAFALPIGVAALTFICAFFVEWKSVKGKKLAPAV
ncbi:major facilitator superfamily domain-containing protein [Xylariales sp. AK1849]|nr:major facilitator superfamily domain-containing protein [Xylariales sp. AK1849]